MLDAAGFPESFGNDTFQKIEISCSGQLPFAEIQVLVGFFCFLNEVRYKDASRARGSLAKEIVMNYSNISLFALRI